MGESVWLLGRPGPTPGDAADRMAALEAAMREAGLIAGETAPEAVLSNPRGPVFRPGPAAEAAVPERFGTLAGLLTNGAEFCAGPVLNWSHLALEGLRAPCCGAEPDEDSFDTFMEQIGPAAGEFDFGKSAVTCPVCHRPSAVNDWVIGPGFLIAGCGLALWNWPPIDPVRRLAEAALGPVVEDWLKI